MAEFYVAQKAIFVTSSQYPFVSSTISVSSWDLGNITQQILNVVRVLEKWKAAGVFINSLQGAALSACSGFQDCFWISSTGWTWDVLYTWVINGVDIYWTEVKLLWKGLWSLQTLLIMSNSNCPCVIVERILWSQSWVGNLAPPPVFSMGNGNDNTYLAWHLWWLHMTRVNTWYLISAKRDKTMFISVSHASI